MATTFRLRIAKNCDKLKEIETLLQEDSFIELHREKETHLEFGDHYYDTVEFCKGSGRPIIDIPTFEIRNNRPIPQKVKDLLVAWGNENHMISNEEDEE